MQRELRTKSNSLFLLLLHTKDKVRVEKSKKIATKNKGYKGVMSRCRKSFADNRNS
jgi:hypothetical protein